MLVCRIVFTKEVALGLDLKTAGGFKFPRARRATFQVESASAKSEKWQSPVCVCGEGRDRVNLIGGILEGNSQKAWMTKQAEVRLWRFRFLPREEIASF